MSDPRVAGSDVEAAIRNAGLTTLDERGLMPLADARALVHATTEFRKAGGRMIGGTWVLDSDRVWAALLSLADADEFVREASRIRWFFHPRGQDNRGPLERYGEAILPWLTTFIRPDGRFVNVPWCVKPCLMAIGTREIFDLVWSVRCVSDGVGSDWPGPFAADHPGDADRRAGTNLDAPAPAEADGDANGLVIGWLYAHPRVGFPLLAERARAGDARAKRMLKSLAQCGPSEVFTPVREALGEADARAIFADAGAPTALDESAILTTLDAAGDDWPALFGDRPDRAYHGLRLIAARAADGDGWGIVFERIEGDDFDSATVRPYVYGSNVSSGSVEDVDDGLAFTLDDADDEEEEDEDDEASSVTPFDLDGTSVGGPFGALELSSSMIAEQDLRPGRATAIGVTSTRFSLLLRAYLTRYPRAFWADPRDAAERLGLGDGAAIIVVSESFQHTAGPHASATYPATWRLRPSESPALRSLARAIVARDPSLFEPGPSNLDFRLHALFEVERERGRDA